MALTDLWQRDRKQLRIQQIGDSDYHYDFDGDYNLFGWYDIQCGDR